ncbi:MAG: hypothetical protein H6Q40_338 [Deltaproteobacteria bacterium]|nr:hypothetical protein [Deltaproteobacteria bacterium]
MNVRQRNKFVMITLVLFIGLLLGGCATYALKPTTQAGPGKAPAIAHSYSIERGRYGDVLKFYIEADDPDNDMLRIATVVEQTGYGRYSTDWIYLKPMNTGHLSGYLKWNTYSPNTSSLAEWTWITVKVSIFDKTGRESNVVVFPFEFVSESIANPTPPAPFDKGDVPMLGNITVNLVEPTRIGGGYRWWD